MALPTSGQISINDLRTEFTGPTPSALNDYYRGGTYVPGTVEANVTATNTSIITLVHTNRGASYTTTPVWNSGSYIYQHKLWRDNGANGDVNIQFKVDKEGTYNLRFVSTISSNDSGLSSRNRVYKNEVLIDDYTRTTTSPNTGTVTYDVSFTFTTSDVIRFKGDWGSGGWTSHQLYFGGSAYNTRTVTQEYNTDVPESGQISLNDFYGAGAA